MQGTLYGVGVGPGDPGNLTYKAVSCVASADVIAVPTAKKEDSVAYKIVREAYGSIDEKEFLEIDFPMTKDEDLLRKSHNDGADKIEKALKEGKNVAFIILGDPCIYGTFIYVYKEIEKRGYKTQIINGIPSFSAVAASLNESISEKDDMIHIIPASYEIKDALRLPGTKILMKTGSKMKAVKDEIRDYIKELKKNIIVKAVENCQMENEKIYEKLEDIPNDAGYYTIVIVKEAR